MSYVNARNILSFCYTYIFQARLYLNYGRDWEKHINLTIPAITHLIRYSSEILLHQEFIQGELNAGVIKTTTYKKEIDKGLAVTVTTYRGRAKIHLGTNRYIDFVSNTSFDDDDLSRTERAKNTIRARKAELMRKGLVIPERLIEDFNDEYGTRVLDAIRSAAAAFLALKDAHKRTPAKSA